MLVLIKTLHTLVWIVMAGATGYIAFSVYKMTFTILFWITLGLIVAEVTVLVLNGIRCPLSDWADRYGQSDKANYDIYLPEWLAKHNIPIFTVIYVLIGLLLLFRLMS